MADVDLVLRGPMTATSGVTSTVNGASRSDTAVGDYIVVIAGDDYISPANLTINNTTGIENPDTPGTTGWKLIAGASAIDYDTKAWLGKATSAGAKTITVSQGPGASGLHVHVGTLNPNGGTVTVDGTPTTIPAVSGNLGDQTSPFTHSSVTTTGTKSLLICAHAQVQFAGTTAYGSAPSGMTVGVANYYNANSGMQSCYQVLTSAGSTGTKDQTATPSPIQDGAGVMFALKSDDSGGGGVPGSSATLYPTTVAGTTGTTWTNTANATGSTTGTYAARTTTTSGAVGTIQLSGYDAQTNTNGGVQPDSLTSLDVSVRFHVTNATARYSSVTVQLFTGTTALGSPTSLTLSITTTNEQTVNLTGSNIPTWAQMSDLRATVSGTKSGTQASVLNIDRVGVVVNYTTAASTPIVGSDSSTVTDSVVINKALTDTHTLSESIAISKPLADSATVTDSVVINKAVSDSATATDSTVANKLVTDANTLTDVTTINKAVSDSSTLTDSSSLSATAIPQAASDSNTLSESTPNIGLNVTDGTITEGLQPDTTLQPSSDLQPFNSNSGSFATLTESAVLSTGDSKAGTDSATLSESVAIFKSFAASDSATLTESIELSKTASDSSTLIDSVIINKAVSDSSTLSDSLYPTKNQTDSAALTDTAAIFRAIAVTDSATATDTSPTESATTPVTDQSTLTDTVTTKTSAVTDSASFTEEKLLAQGDNYVSVDSAELTDTISSSVTTSRTDSTTFSESTPNISTTRTETATFGEFAVVSISTDDSLVFVNTITHRSTFVRDQFETDELGAFFNAWIVKTDSIGFIDNALFESDDAQIVNLNELSTYQPSKSRPYRLIAQDSFTKEFLHWDLPVDNILIKKTISGPTLISGTINTEVKSLFDLDPPIEPQRTRIHYEEDGRILASGILMAWTDDNKGKTRTLEAEGNSTYPHWIIYEDESYQGVQVDPADMIRKLWDYVQSANDSNIGVQVSATTTPVRIGTEPENVEFETDAGENVSFIAGPYALNFWTVTNCGDEIDKLCKETPIEYVERSDWNAAKTDVLHYIDLGYPRVGGRRADLGFREGENFYDLIPQYSENKDNYASRVIVVGAGDGPDAIRQIVSAHSVPPRLKRDVVIQNEDITSNDRALAIAQFEFRRRALSKYEIQSITIDTTHINAPFGSFQEGDDILVEGFVQYIGKIADLHRIVSYTYNPKAKTAQLDLKPSESFDYGALKVEDA